MHWSNKQLSIKHIIQQQLQMTAQWWTWSKK